MLLLVEEDLSLQVPGDYRKTVSFPYSIFPGKVHWGKNRFICAVLSFSKTATTGQCQRWLDLTQNG